MPLTLCIDFDGVIHSYNSKWQGVDVIPDPPVAGAIEWLKTLLNRPDEFEVCIYSSRSKEDKGILAMRMWLGKWGIGDAGLQDLKFPTQKPAAFLTIDDRAIQFTGTFPVPEHIKYYKPWNKHITSNRYLVFTTGDGYDHRVCYEDELEAYITTLLFVEPNELDDKDRDYMKHIMAQVNDLEQWSEIDSDKGIGLVGSFEIDDGFIHIALLPDVIE